VFAGLQDTFSYLLAFVRIILRLLVYFFCSNPFQHTLCRGFKRGNASTQFKLVHWARPAHVIHLTGAVAQIGKCSRPLTF